MLKSKTVAIAICAYSLASGTTAKAEIIYALLNNDPTIGQQLVSFDSTTRAVLSTVVLQTANTISPLASIDVRPASGQLYGFDASARQLYTITVATGGLTAIGAPLSAGSIVGGNIDFNPTVDRIRLVGANGENLRLNPDTGAVAATDPNLAYAVGDTNEGDAPAVRAVGYTNSVAGATMTTLYDIDVNNDVLIRQDPANDGTLITVGSLGVDLNAGLFGTFTDFDISGATGNAFLTDGPFAGDSTLYSVNLATGVATSLGTITGLPTGRTVAAIAVGPAVPEPATMVLMVIGMLAAIGKRQLKV